jgi:hypothetical protein
MMWRCRLEYDLIMKISYGAKQEKKEEEEEATQL